MTHNFAARSFFWCLLSLFFLFLGYQVLYSNYALTDEAYRLWHRVDQGTAFNDFHAQGRTLGGLMVQVLFEKCHTVEDIRYVRLLSLVECILLTGVLFAVLKGLQRKGLSVLSDPVIYLTVAFAASSLTFSNWISWAVSTIIFIPAMLSLLAGYILYRRIGPSSGRPILRGSNAWLVPVLLAMVLSVIALFFYQSPYPFLLLPFYLLFLSRKDGRFDQPVYTGILFYFAFLVIYYALFKGVLRLTNMGASPRTALATNPFQQLSFFFSYPLNQAFSVNVLFDVKSIFSQLLMPLQLLAWIFIVFRKGPVRQNTRYVLGILLFWILGFLPQMVGREGAAPYRTMLVLTTMVFILQIDTVFLFIHSSRARTWVSLVIAGILLAKGAYNYKVYLTGPLGKEYQAIQKIMHANYNERIKEIVFVRPHENGFKEVFGIDSYTDEFGMPSSHKDWTPEPLLKQMVYEMTGKKPVADALKVTQFMELAEIRDTALLYRDTVLFINAPALLQSLK